MFKKDLQKCELVPYNQVFIHTNVSKTKFSSVIQVEDTIDGHLLIYGKGKTQGEALQNLSNRLIEHEHN
jgi:hypothetical protein